MIDRTQSTHPNQPRPAPASPSQPQPAPISPNQAQPAPISPSQPQPTPIRSPHQPNQIIGFPCSLTAWFQSLSGSIAEQALHVAATHSVPTFSFNLVAEDVHAKHEASSHEPLPSPVRGVFPSPSPHALAIAIAACVCHRHRRMLLPSPSPHVVAIAIAPHALPIAIAAISPARVCLRVGCLRVGCLRVRQVVHHIVGCCEVTLPKLTALAAAPRATSSASGWYEGRIPAAAEAEAMASYGVDWTEVTSGDGRKMRSRSKKRNREKVLPRHETMWVACDRCGKWRRLPPGVTLSEDEANARWRCEQNVGDPERRSCDAPEEPWN